MRIRQIEERILRWLVGREVFGTLLQEHSNRLAVKLLTFGVFISVSFVIMDLAFQTYAPLVVHFMLLSSATIGVILSRKGRIEAAKVIVMLIFNISIYLSFAAEEPEEGTYLYFFIMVIAAYVIFDYKRIHLSILFTILTFGLYMLAMLTDFSILPKYNYPPETTKVVFAINVTVFTVVTILIFVLYKNMVHSRNKQINNQNVELQQTNRELDKFLYSTSHDLRAPLATVLGLLNVIDLSQTRKDIRKYHDLMHDRLDKMENLIADIIDVIKNSRLPVSKKKIDLKSMVDNLYNDLKHLTCASNIRFTNQIPSNLRINSDEMRVQCILQNLLSNSLKYTDCKKSQLQMEVMAKEDNGHVNLIFQDNGIGIPKDQLDKIFEMFYKATEQSKGAGLGLYIVSETVRKLEGAVYADSEPGVGTSIQVSLPRN